MVNSLVARSWQECRCRGVDPWRRSSTTADPGKWQQILQRSRLLLQTAGPIMQSVHEIIRDSHFLLALTDEEGYVLSTIGDDAILARSENILFRRGSVWRNDQVGTNAPGIALEYNQPVQLIGAEHYCADQHGWTCSAAPIHGVDGAVIGSLDLSGSAGAAHPHTLALVVACAFSIERTLISYHQSHFMRAAANGIRESILLLNDKLELRWANATAQRELGLSQARLAGLDFHQVMPQVDWDMTDDAHRHAPLYIDDLRVVLPGNVRRFSATISQTADATDRFLARFNERYPSRQRHLAPDAMPALLAYDWPGNVRELQNALERAFYTSSGPAITASDFHLPSSQHDALSPSSPLSPESPAEAASYERAECLHYLEEARGCVEQAASAMGVSRATFYRLCRHYGIVPKQIRRQFH